MNDEGALDAHNYIFVSDWLNLLNPVLNKYQTGTAQARCIPMSQYWYCWNLDNVMEIMCLSKWKKGFVNTHLKQLLCENCFKDYLKWSKRIFWSSWSFDKNKLLELLSIGFLKWVSGYPLLNPTKRRGAILCFSVHLSKLVRHILVCHRLRHCLTSTFYLYHIVLILVFLCHHDNYCCFILVPYRTRTRSSLPARFYSYDTLPLPIPHNCHFFYTDTIFGK